MMKNLTQFARPLILGLALATVGVAYAQPTADGGAGAQNPANQNAGGRGGNRPQLTEAQRTQLQAQQQQMRELSLRQMLTTGGFTDTAVQDEIVTYYTEKEKASQALQEKGRRLTEAARGTTVTDAQLTTMLNDFRAAVEEERARRVTAQEALAAQLSLATKPRLDAMLMMAGLIGDEAQYLGGRGGSGQGGFGNNNANNRGNGRGGN